ncbi:MAG: AI-2E family transporter [Proteobacteria bacterium]|nr:AI-2E family transporter [Pseudomonadota bacterium]
MHSTFYRRCFHLTLAAVLGYLLLQVLRPFFGMLAWAALLGYMFFPLQERLTRSVFKGRRSLSAGFITALGSIAVFVPLSILGVVFAGQVARLITYLHEHSPPSWSDLLERLSHYPVVGSAVDWVRENSSVTADQLQGWMTEGLQGALKSVAALGGSLALGIFGTLVSFFMMLFILFFFLRDGRTLAEHAIRLIPAPPQRRDRALKYLGDVTRAVVFGSVGTAVFQGIFVGLGFAIAGLPSPVVFGVLAVFASFLPSGASIVVIPAILYFAFTAHWGWATFLLVWTAILASADNVLRPILAARHAEVSTLALFLGAIGGAAAFGIIGLVAGPVLVSFVVALARFSQETPPADA